MNDELNIYDFKTIGDLLAHLRNSHKWSYRKAEQVSGLSHSYIRYVESNQRKASPEALQKLSDAYKFPYEQLLLKSGYISEQYIFDPETGIPRLQTIEETIAFNASFNKRQEIILEEFLSDSNNVLTYYGHTLTDYERNKLIEAIQQVLKLTDS